MPSFPTFELVQVDQNGLAALINSEETPSVEWTRATATTMSPKNGKKPSSQNNSLLRVVLQAVSNNLLNQPIIEFIYRSPSKPAFRWAFSLAISEANNSDDAVQRAFLPLHLPKTSADATAESPAISKWSSIIFAKSM
jgi:hypothetical protein